MFYGLGNILGAGIYVLIGKVVGVAGIYAPVSFVIASLLATFTAFSYAELSSRYPLSAGESEYIQHGFNKKTLSLIIGLLIVLAGALSSAAIIRGFTGYLDVFVETPATLTIAVLVLTLGGIAAWGITQSVRMAAILTVIEIIGLSIILWVGGGAFAELPARIGELVPGMDGGIWYGIFLGGLLAFYAYIGFEDMVNIAEEVKNPSRNMPVAILIALIVSALIYFLVALVSVMSVDLQQLAASDAPLAYIYEQITGSNPAVITVIGMFAIINGALIQIIMASRILYGLGRRGWLPARLGSVNTFTRTPLPATFLTCVIILLFALTSTLEGLAENTSFVILIVFALVNLSLLLIKRREAISGETVTEGVRVVPFWIPVVGLVSSLGFVVFRIIDFINGI